MMRYLLLCIGFATAFAQTCTCDSCSLNEETFSGTVDVDSISCPSGQMAFASKINMDTTDAGSFSGQSTFTVSTHTSSGISYFDGSYADSTTCFNTLTAAIGGQSNDIFVTVTCTNYFESCPLEYDIQLYCGAADPCANVFCNLHGSCSNGQCICTDGYSGMNCGTPPTSSGCSTDSDCGGTMVCDIGSGSCVANNDPCAGVNCGHGTCSGGTCQCEAGYAMPSCTTVSGGGGGGGANTVSNWVGSWNVDTACDQQVCCCLFGELTLTEKSSTSLSMSAHVKGQCGSQSSLSVVWTGVTASSWNGLVGTDMFTVDLNGDTITATNHADNRCSGQATRATTNSASHPLFGGVFLSILFVFYML